TARLQVEHPVTELVTGIDLVKAQLAIAAGETLPIREADAVQHGWAIECRLSAEDPYHQFLPSTGRILGVREPSGPGVRVASALYPGLQASLSYHPLPRTIAFWSPTPHQP